MDFTRLLKELEGEREKGLKELIILLEKAAKEKPDILSDLLKHFAAEKDNERGGLK